MGEFNVHVTIENKPGISDPEGDTILNDLVLKGSESSISKIRTAKMLKFTIKEDSKKTAEKKIQDICESVNTVDFEGSDAGSISIERPALDINPLRRG